MLKALGFIVKFLILAGAIAYLVSLPGVVAIATLDYQLDMPLGYLLAGVVGVVFFALIFFQLLDGAVRFPRWVKHWRDRTKGKKGQQAILRSLSALAAGDAKIGYYQAWRAASLLPPEQHNLPILLQAQAAQMKGETTTANALFTRLLDNPDTAFLGLRGLLRGANDSMDYARIRRIAEATKHRFPKQPWLVKASYDMKLRQLAWGDALDDLKLLAKSRVYEPAQIQADRAALHTCMAQDAEMPGQNDAAIKHYKRALKYDPSFLPAALALARFYRRQGQLGKMVAVIRHIWPLAPCTLLADLWGEAAPAKSRKIGARLQWFEQLHNLNETSYESLLMMARIALDEGFNGQAKTYLARAEKHEKTALFYQLSALLLKKTNGSEEDTERLLLEASRAQNDKTWTCQQTHHTFENWQPLIMPEGLFNTIRWATPPSRAGLQNSTGLLQEFTRPDQASGMAAQLQKPAHDFASVRSVYARRDAAGGKE
ncbi:MAG: tetratricopeptide repeat protein [Alphaproteobacteria bacterium]|nr:tetratricopeptide repeat protein [Alphaproteobacteria bacterium]